MTTEKNTIGQRYNQVSVFYQYLRAIVKATREKSKKGRASGLVCGNRKATKAEETPRVAAASDIKADADDVNT